MPLLQEERLLGLRRYLGFGTLSGKRFERYRSGSLTLWLASDGAIRHVSASVNSYAIPVCIDFRRPDPQGPARAHAPLSYPMEPRGIEPLTFWLPARRSPS